MHQEAEKFTGMNPGFFRTGWSVKLGFSRMFIKTIENPNSFFSHRVYNTIREISNYLVSKIVSGKCRS